MSVILEQYNPHEIEPEVQEHWLSQKTFKAKEDPSKEKILLPLHVSISIWASPHGARTQLYYR